MRTDSQFEQIWLLSYAIAIPLCTTSLSSHCCRAIFPTHSMIQPTKPMVCARTCSWWLFNHYLSFIMKSRQKVRLLPSRNWRPCFFLLLSVLYFTGQKHCTLVPPEPSVWIRPWNLERTFATFRRDSVLNRWWPDAVPHNGRKSMLDKLASHKLSPLPHLWVSLVLYPFRGHYANSFSCETLELLLSWENVLTFRLVLVPSHKCHNAFLVVLCAKVVDHLPSWHTSLYILTLTLYSNLSRCPLRRMHCLTYLYKYQ